MRMRSCTFSWVAIVVGLVSVGRAAEPDPELIQAEKTLQDAKIELTGAGLLQFFRDHTLTRDDRKALADAVKRLGDDDFEKREKAEQELIRAGRKAVPFLRPAVRDDDFERARRDARCLEELNSGLETGRITAAARVLSDRKPEGAAAALLAYLPDAADEWVEDALFRALLAVAMKEGKAAPALVEALGDEQPLRRAAAAHVLGRLDPKQRPAIRKLLEDADARVRFETALGLALAGDKDAVPALVALVGKGPIALAWRAQDVLYRIAGDKSPSLTLTDDDGPKRQKAADAWSAWWKDAAPTIDLSKLNLDGVLQGINVICQEGSGNNPARVWACRADGKPLWEIKNVPAWDAQLLPNGHVLIAEYGTGQVTERDLTGKVLMTVKLAGGQHSTCQRLPNGNTFITTLSEFMEIDPKGTKLWGKPDPAGGWVGRARKLPSGNILYACDGYKIVELDSDFKRVRTVEVPKSGDSWMSIEPLPGDRFLVAPYGAHKVMEVDGAGKIVWECPTQAPMCATRLPNGNTLVGSNAGHAIYEYDRAGKEVWKLQLDSSVRCVRRY